MTGRSEVIPICARAELRVVHGNGRLCQCSVDGSLKSGVSAGQWFIREAESLSRQMACAVCCLDGGGDVM